MISNNVYLFIGGVTGTVTSWVVPAGVTGIKVECYGASGFGTVTVSSPYNVYPGGSYSCVNNLAVTAGQTITFQMPTFGGSTSTWASKTGVAPTTASEGCLAVSGAVAQASQVASNIGNIIFTGGNGFNDSFNFPGFGGQAGLSGPGANASSVNFNSGGNVFSGGGASGGTSTTANGVIPKGRYGSDTVGSGGYLDAGFSIVAPTDDGSIQASYVNGLLQNNLYSWGAFGGSAIFYDGGAYNYSSYPGFIVITLIAGRKYIVVNTAGTSYFTAPSDFGSLVSLEAIGAGGNGDNTASGTSRYGGGGGGGYAKNTSAGLLAQSIVAGVTEFTAIMAGGASQLRLGESATIDTGVVAFNGANASLNTAGAGGIGNIGNTLYSGGAGGAGSTSTRLNAGGGGGAAGPLGAGGAGGAANNNGTNRGGGGGGGANNGGVGAAANTTTPFVSGNGGTGSSGASAGGNGNTAANPSGTTNGASGASSGSTVGGGGGGGSGFSVGNTGAGGFVDNGVYRIGGGAGGFSSPVLSNGTSGNYPGAGGGGRSSVSGGQGLVVMAYTPKITYTNGNFFQLL
jgi:hypothetical protein